MTLLCRMKVSCCLDGEYYSVGLTTRNADATMVSREMRGLRTICDALLFFATRVGQHHNGTRVFSPRALRCCITIPRIAVAHPLALLPLDAVRHYDSDEHRGPARVPRPGPDARRSRLISFSSSPNDVRYSADLEANKGTCHIPRGRRCSFQTALHTVAVNPGGAFLPKENPRNGTTEPSRPSGTLETGIIEFTLVVSCWLLARIANCRLQP
jgi:hypothetical protein